jgi:zinc protease
MHRNATRIVLAVTALIALIAACAPTVQTDTIETVTLPSPGSPLVPIRLMFSVGSIHDPAGKEGLAALTGMMVGEAGTQTRTYGELIEALYPMASSIDVHTDREVTVISGVAHIETLDDYTKLLTEAVLQPGFDESDFARNKEQLMSYLTTTLRATNDELLGLEAIQQVIFDGHPYEQSPAGTVEGLENITLDDVKAFYGEHYTRANLMLGVAGGYADGFVDQLTSRLSALPEGEAGSPAALPTPAPVAGRQFTLVEKETDSVGIHFGYHLPVNRADADYYPLMVANSFLGEHRTFHGRLMQQLRGERGLNYGDYSYIEYWNSPPFTSNPAPNYPRRQQYFSVWIRPVVPTTAHFALRNAIHEVDRLIENGMTQEEFELTRDFVTNYSKLWARTLANRLGFLMDSEFYGMPYYIDEIDERLAAMTVDDVNAAIRKHLQTENFHAVLVTRNAADVEAWLEADEPSPMQYNTVPKPEVVEADTVIEVVEVAPDGISIVPIEQMFQR